MASLTNIVPPCLLSCQLHWEAVKEVVKQGFFVRMNVFCCCTGTVEVKCCTPALAKPGVKGSIGLISNVPQPVCYRSMKKGKIKWQTVKDLFTKNLMVSHGEVSSCRTKIFTFCFIGGLNPIMACRGKTVLNTNNNHIILVYRFILKYCKRQRNTT